MQERAAEEGQITHWFDVLWCFTLPFCFDLTSQVKGGQTSFLREEPCLPADVLTSHSRIGDERQDSCADECSRGSAGRQKHTAGGGAPVAFYQKVRFTLNRQRIPPSSLQLLQVWSLIGSNVLPLGLKQLSNFLSWPLISGGATSFQHLQ